jgi:hypothetical protein
MMRTTALLPIIAPMSGQVRTLIDLATRESGTLHVTLLWSPGDEFVTISVRDPGIGEPFDLVVAARDALEVYNHPFAYAASRGVEYELAA